EVAPRPGSCAGSRRARRATATAVGRSVASNEGVSGPAAEIAGVAKRVCGPASVRRMTDGICREMRGKSDEKACRPSAARRFRSPAEVLLESRPNFAHAVTKLRLVAATVIVLKRDEAIQVVLSIPPQE